MLRSFVFKCFPIVQPKSPTLDHFIEILLYQSVPFRFFDQITRLVNTVFVMTNSIKYEAYMDYDRDSDPCQRIRNVRQRAWRGETGQSFSHWPTQGLSLTYPQSVKPDKIMLSSTLIEISRLELSSWISIELVVIDPLPVEIDKLMKLSWCFSSVTSHGKISKLVCFKCFTIGG